MASYHAAWAPGAMCDGLVPHSMGTRLQWGPIKNLRSVFVELK